MSADDLLLFQLESVIDLGHPLASLARVVSWGEIESEVRLARAHPGRTGDPSRGAVADAGIGRLPTRLMVSLLCFKRAFSLSDEQVLARWVENVQWQYFSGMTYYERRSPCLPADIAHFEQVCAGRSFERLAARVAGAASRSGACCPVPAVCA